MARRERVSVIGPVMCQLRKMIQRSWVDQVKSICRGAVSLAVCEGEGDGMGMEGEEKGNWGVESLRSCCSARRRRHGRRGSLSVPFWRFWVFTVGFGVWNLVLVSRRWNVVADIAIQSEVDVETRVVGLPYS